MSEATQKIEKQKKRFKRDLSEGIFDNKILTATSNIMTWLGILFIFTTAPVAILLLANIAFSSDTTPFFVDVMIIGACLFAGAFFAFMMTLIWQDIREDV